LKNKPKIIAIDVGRQLFLDDFLNFFCFASQCFLERVWCRGQVIEKKKL